VDEVLSVGDFMFQQKCERRITDLIKNHGVTVLIVSHSNDQIERLCNKAIWIEKGHTRMMGPASEVCSAYRVVGGREGSVESEHRVIEMMHTELAEGRMPESYFTSISGETRFSTGVDIADGYLADQKTVIITDTEWHKDCMMATALAGLTEAVLLNCGVEGMPGVTAQMIKRIGATRSYVVGPYDFLPESIDDELAELTGTRPVRLATAGVGTSSLEVYEYGKTELGGWGDTALVASEDSISTLIPLSRLVYKLKMPVFMMMPETGEEFAGRIADVVARDFKRAIVVKGRQGLFDIVYEKLEQAGVDIVRFDVDDEVEANIAASDWIAEQDRELGLPPADKLLVTTVWKPIDAFLIGPYLEKNNAEILLGDPGSLDATCKTFDFLERRGGSIEKLIFLGGQARYSYDDRKTLAKALARTRGEARLDG